MKIFNSIKEASQELNINGSNICQCCKGKRKEAGGYQWRYKEDAKDKIASIAEGRVHLNEKIYQYDIEVHLVHIYKNIEDVQKIYNIEKSHLSQACNGKIKYVLNYQWRYESLVKIYPVYSSLPNYKRKVCQIDKKTLKVVKEFDNAQQAAQELNINRGNLGQCLNGKRKSCGGYFWKYK